MRALCEAAHGVVYLREVEVAIIKVGGKGEIASNPQCPHQTTRVTKSFKVGASATNQEVSKPTNFTQNPNFARLRTITRTSVTTGSPGQTPI